MKFYCKYKITWFVFLLAALMLFSNCGEKTETTDRKANCSGDQCKRELILALEDLSKIEMPENGGEKQVDEKIGRIEKIVERFNNPHDVSGLALLSKAMVSHCSVPDVTCSKESRLIATYDNAFWACVRNLARNAEKNRDVLEQLKFMSNLNGTQKGSWASIVEGKEFP